MVDYYELLKISHNADSDTIHRVYKYLAARHHPDNVKTGDAATFQLLKTAYDVLSNPTRRAEYDAKQRRQPPPPLSSTIDFMDQVEGELNRRMAVLAVLYYRRRSNPNYPEVSLAELEVRMGFPRDYLDFTMWYLVKKKYAIKADNATYELTADGVDFVEKERVIFPVLNGLLASTAGPSAPYTAQSLEEAFALPEEPSPIATKAGRATTPIVLPATGKSPTDERRGRVDRRVNAPDRRIIKVERRRDTAGRRANSKEL
jgi:curved DNA-binding protein